MPQMRREKTSITHDNFATGFRRRTEAHGFAGADGGDVRDEDRNPFARGDDDLGELVGIGDAAVGLHGERLAALLNGAGAGAGVVASQCFSQVGEAQSRSRKALRVGPHDVLLDVAADDVDAGQARHGLQLRGDDPVLDGA